MKLFNLLRAPGRVGIHAVLRCILLGLLGTLLLPALAIDFEEANRIPHVNERGQEAFKQFLFAGGHRAFAIAPGGAWAWSAESGSGNEAADVALKQCRSNSRQRCVLYAVDDEVVFDRETWPTLWSPYQSRDAASRAPVGIDLGQRFPDLSFNTAEGRPVTLADLRDKVVVLHFWGSWCPPCRKELPNLQRLHDALAGRQDITIVLLQIREPFQQSNALIERLGLALRLHDSGVMSEQDTRLTLAGGGSIEDRKIARLFPSTYVLDGNGIVVYKHLGAARDWMEYLPFLDHTAEHTTPKAGGSKYALHRLPHRLPGGTFTRLP